MHIQVLFQFAYTTVFGWYATHLFLATGHLAAPVTAHVFCNLMGVPPFGAMASSRHRRLLGAATLAGIAGFALLLRPLTAPALFGNGAAPAPARDP